MILNYYLLAQSFDYHCMSESDNLMDRIFKIQDISVLVQEHDKSILIPNSIYHQEIEPGIALVDWMYGESDQLQDERKLLELVFREGLQVDEDDYESNIRALIDGEHLSFALIGFYTHVDGQIPNSTCIWDANDWLFVHRYFLRHCQHTENLLIGFYLCFPKLHFSDHVQSSIKIFKPIRDYIDEIIRHLSVLNDHALNLFIEHRNAGESEVLNRISITGGIACSIQGNPVYERSNLSFYFMNDQSVNELVICSPHTKLFNNYSGYRIYFHWGKTTIQKGNKLLIGHIGEHL